MSQARPKWHFYAYLLNLITNKTALNTHINNTEIKLLQYLHLFIFIISAGKQLYSYYLRPNSSQLSAYGCALYATAIVFASISASGLS